MATLTSNLTPGAILSRFRGQVIEARLTYPERARIDVTDAEGQIWGFGTWEAQYAPADPQELAGKTVISADIAASSGKLTIGFADGTCFTVTPIPDDAEDAMEHWELFTPEGLVLSYGPWGRWHIGKATDPC